MVSTGLIDFGYTGAPQSNTYFNLPNYSLPYGDSSFSYVSRIGNYTSATLAVLVGGGVATNGAGMHIDINHSSVGKVGVDLYNYGLVNMGTFSTNSVITCKYTSGNPANGINISIDKTQAGTGTAGLIRTQDYGYNAIGTSLAPGTNWSNQNPLNSQVYNLYNFSSVLTGPGANTDQSIVESTPYQYSAPAAITGLATSSTTVNNFVLGWTAVTNATLYSIYVNGVFIASTTLISLTITPGFYGPWNINVYAYSASNALIATGYITLNVSPVVTIVPITNNVIWPAVSNTLTTQSLTATNTGYAALNGTYTVTCSIAATNADTRVYIGAILSNNNGVMWQSPSGIYAVSAGTGGGQNLYTVNTGRSTTASGTSYSGEWFTFQFPAPITLSIFTIAQQWGPPSNIYQFYLVGSNDGSTWTYMYGATAAYNAGASTQNFTVNSSQGFTYIRFIVNSVAANQGIWLSYVNMTGNGIGF
jgi:hypothetical protein